jgi:CelD/BcsL family acetyltransferase involved in cellulose biosynthesis
VADEIPDPTLASRERIEILDGLQGIDELAPAWEELADQVAAPPWWRPAWVGAWWRAFGRGRLQLIAGRRGDRLVGVVPVERRGGELRSTSNYHTPSFGLLVADDHALRSLATALVQAAPRQLTISFLPEGQPSLAALEDASRRARRPLLVRVLERCPYIPIEGTWSDLLASRRGHLAREIRRRRRKLGARGRLELDVQDGRQDLNRLLEEGFAVEAASWKGEGGTAIASTPATRAFYTEIAHWLAARGALRLSFLRLDGRPFAFDFAVEEGDRHSLLKTGYDAAFRADAPGVLLRASMIEQAFEHRLRRYDFLGKDDPWKREWTSTVENQVRLQSFGRSPAGMADWAAQRYLRPLARRILRRRG